MIYPMRNQLLLKKWLIWRMGERKSQLEVERKKGHSERKGLMQGKKDLRKKGFGINFLNNRGGEMKSFIDTNVFVHWIILKKIKEKQQSEQLWKQFRKIRPSFELLELIRDETLDDFSFITSQLCISEIFIALFDEYICRRMYSDGVPLSSWQRVRNRFNLEKNESNELTESVLDFLKEFDIIDILKTNKKVDLVQEHYNYPLISKLVIEKKFRTHDAVLTSTAHNSGCEYFVTGDKHIREIKVDVIKIISPQQMIHEIKKRAKKDVKEVIEIKEKIIFSDDILKAKEEHEKWLEELSKSDDKKAMLSKKLQRELELYKKKHHQPEDY